MLGKSRIIAISCFALAYGCSTAGYTPSARWQSPWATSASQSLFVISNIPGPRFKGGSIDVYSVENNSLTGQITRKVDAPGRLGFDKSRNLYVLNNTLSVAEYAPGSTRPFRVIRTGLNQVYDMTLDRFGTLYVANGFPAPGSVTVYEPGSVTPVRTITAAIKYPPVAISVDPDGDLYVGQDANGGASRITVYNRNGALVRTIRDGVIAPYDLIFDNTENLYVANFATSTRLGNNIQVYPPGAVTPIRTIAAGINGPFRMAFNAGKLFVANRIGNSVTVYRSASTTSLYTITDGISQPEDLTFDAAGALYVSNLAQTLDDGWVSVYAPGAIQPSAKMDRRGRLPGALAIDRP